MTTSHPDAPTLMLFLTTSGGRVGSRDLFVPGDTMSWNRDDSTAEDWDQTVTARFELRGRGREEVFEIDGDAWRELEMNCDLDAFINDCKGSGIELSLRAQLDNVENTYSCEPCGQAWTDCHSCGCDDECPTCGVAVSPDDTNFLSGLTDQQPARFVDHS